MLLSDVCLSRTSGLSREQSPSNTKIGTEIAHFTRDSRHHFQGQKVKVTKAAILTAALTRKAVQRSAWERIQRGKVLLRCVCSGAREALGRPRGSRGAGHIVSPRAQLVCSLNTFSRCNNKAYERDIKAQGARTFAQCRISVL